MSDVPVDVTPVKKAWAKPGYNCVGFDDEDFDNNNFKRKGPYLDCRYKLNQDTIKCDLAIRRKVTAKQVPKLETIDQFLTNILTKLKIKKWP